MKDINELFKLYLEADDKTKRTIDSLLTEGQSHSGDSDRQQGTSYRIRLRVVSDQNYKVQSWHL